MCSMAIAVLDYTPFADWFFKALHFGLYELTWWPRKVVWKLFYALDSMLLPNFVTAQNRGYSLMSQDGCSYT